MTASAPPLRDALEDYLMLRRALGFKLASAARLLGQFVSYLEACGTTTVTTSDALAWAVLPAGASPAWQAIRLSVVRGFAAYLNVILSFHVTRGCDLRRLAEDGVSDETVAA